MLVGERMTRDPVTVQVNEGIEDALKMMRDSNVRRLPVLDKGGKLVGIVSDKDLLYASPSPATSLSVHELHYLLSKLTVEKVMSSPVIWVTEYTPLEEAARIMVDNKIGGLPVLRDDKVVGIITETDMFKIFLEMLGARSEGVRLSMLVPEAKGILADLTAEIARLGGNILSLGTFYGEEPSNVQITVKVEGVDKEELLEALEGIAVEILDVRVI
ncbi:MAG TPA: CBS and ACT domain-containing protein [Anaerolineae bacterium]|nr:CBS and ACT domain-containing protein [Anaerolineae bacterium]